VTGHCKSNEPLDLDWNGLASAETTLIVYMGLANLSEIVRQLIVHGLPGDTPTLAVCQGTTPRERRVSSPLVKLVAAVQGAKLTGPVLVIIGRVAALAWEWKESENAGCIEDIAVVA
jgi:siroheme synthase